MSVQHYNESHEKVIWLHRMMNMPLAYQTTPADYLMSFCVSSGPQLVLVECKQITDDDRLAVSRLKQMSDLIAFDKMYAHHKSYFLINFWKGRADTSFAYMIPAHLLNEFIRHNSLKSIKLETFQGTFYKYQLTLNGKYYDVERFINSIDYL